MAAAHELIVGGQRSGKSRHAETLALRWQAGGGRVAVIATALAADAEMRSRIAHHRATRPAGFDTIERGDPHCHRFDERSDNQFAAAERGAGVRTNHGIFQRVRIGHALDYELSMGASGRRHVRFLPAARGEFDRRHL